MTIIINNTNWEAGTAVMTVVTWVLGIAIAFYVYLGDRQYMQSKKVKVK